MKTNGVRSMTTVAGLCAALGLASASGRNATLEDFLGAPTGETFQAAIGIRNEEKAGPNRPDPAVGFGLAVDDVELRWREFSLVEDQTECGATGECAVIGLVSGSLFENRTLLTITVLDKTPDAVNDCDLDGNPDPVPTNDCDNNGVRDVVVRATSPTEITGEIVYLNASGNPNEYRGDLPVSNVADVPGVLFITQVGSANAVATVFYEDTDFNGMGDPCPNNATPAFQGTVQASTTFFIQTGDVLVIDAALTDNGDNDGFADTNETVSMRIRVRNRGAAAITGLRARLASNDPKIDCIIGPDIFIGDVSPAGEVLSSEAFVFRVADVDRGALGLTNLDTMAAEFSVLLRADQFDVPSDPQTLTLDLDLDASGGGTATTYLESFEQNTLDATSFNADNIDAGRNNEVNSEGYRCQYHDPDNPQSNSFDVITNCFLGATGPQAAAFFWQVHRPDAIDGGRAFSGTRSLYMGIFGSEPDEHTTPMATLEAVKSDPINLGVAGAAPELTFKHQISLLDSRSVGAPDVRTADRAVVMLQLADPDTGAPVGDWIKLRPFVNVYDQQAVDNYFQCSFDPVDDGTTEDDLFDPGAPGRPYGPSSTCFSGGATFDSVFAHVGDTFRPFNPNNLGRASDGPGLEGSLGIGTWVESKVSLLRFKGRRVKLRFLTTALKVSQATWEQQFTFNPNPSDDGWWIDDVQVTNTLTLPATVSRDDKPNDALPPCGAVCNTITPVLTADVDGDGEPDDPATSGAPGQVVELSAVDSFADRCLDGILQFRFWIDGDENGVAGGGADTLLRSWTDNPDIVQAPDDFTDYVVEVRCSNDVECVGSGVLRVNVPCPGGCKDLGTVKMPNRQTLEWDCGRLGNPPAQAYDYARGALPMRPPYTTLDLLFGEGPAQARNVGTAVPPSGGGWWYLIRPIGTLGTGSQFPRRCNDPFVTWAARDNGASPPAAVYRNLLRDADLP